MTKWLRRDIHTLALCYALFTDDGAFQKELKLLKVKEDVAFLKKTYSSATVHFLEHEGNQVALVCLPLKSGVTLEQYHALLVHEAVHIWQRHCELIGEDRPSTEMEAYAIQLISQDLMLSFKEQRGKGKL